MAAPTTTVIVSAGTAIGGAHPIDALALAHACGADVQWVVQLVEIGIVELPEPAPPPARPEAWRFGSEALQRALEARRLERDFGTSLDVAALILDLQHEVRRLKGVLARHAVNPGT